MIFNESIKFLKNAKECEICPHWPSFFSSTETYFSESFTKTVKFQTVFFDQEANFGVARRLRKSAFCERSLPCETIFVGVRFLNVERGWNKFIFGFLLLNLKSSYFHSSQNTWLMLKSTLLINWMQPKLSLKIHENLSTISRSNIFSLPFNLS